MVRWLGFCSALVGVILVASTGATSATTVKTLYDFCSENGCADGSAPAGGLLRDGNGNLYGTTTLGGAHGFGAVFELKRNGDSWTYQVLHSFCSSCGDSAFPQSKLVLDTAGNLYGTAPSNGELDCGVVFRLSPNADGSKWKLRRLRRCSEKGNPNQRRHSGQRAMSALGLKRTVLLCAVSGFDNANGSCQCERNFG